jgi:hypothetical protein
MVHQRTTLNAHLSWIRCALYTCVLKRMAMGRWLSSYVTVISNSADISLECFAQMSVYHGGVSGNIHCWGLSIQPSCYRALHFEGKFLPPIFGTNSCSSLLSAVLVCSFPMLELKLIYMHAPGCRGCSFSCGCQLLKILMVVTICAVKPATCAQVQEKWWEAGISPRASWASHKLCTRVWYSIKPCSRSSGPSLSIFILCGSCILALFFVSSNSPLWNLCTC